MSEQHVLQAALINNFFGTAGKDRLRRLRTSIESFPATVHTFLYSEMEKVREGEFDCMILSGSNLNVSNPKEREKMDDEINLIKEIEIPVLAICFGLHLAVHAYEGNIERNENSGEFSLPTGKEIAIEIQTDPEELICCSNVQVQVNVNHKDYVSPDDPQYSSLSRFVQLVSIMTQDTCSMQSIKKKPYFVSNFIQNLPILQHQL